MFSTLRSELAFAPIRANLILMNFLVACQIAALKDNRNDRTRNGLPIIAERRGETHAAYYQANKEAASG